MVRQHVLRALLLSVMIGCSASETPEQRYTVQRGDTLFVLGNTYGVSVQQLKDWNKLDSDRIEVGQELIVGMNASQTAPQQRPAPRPSTRVRPKVQPTSAALQMPKPKPCLAGPRADELQDDAGYVGSTGLDADAIKSSLTPFLPNIHRCFSTTESVPTTTLLLDFRVGCDGQVTNIQVSSAGDWDSNLTDCVTGILRYTPFPAHALPDGEQFSYPIRLSQ